MAGWRPGQRSAYRQLEAPYEDVPTHLAQPLWSWVEGFLWEDADTVLYIGVTFRLQLPDPRQGSSVHQRAVAKLLNEVNARPTLVLDLIEWILDIYGNRRGAAEALETLLFVGNSIYTVRTDFKGLEVRVVPEVKEQVQAVVDAAGGSPGAHLATSWSEAYARGADPVKAYSEAIKAVEAAAAPIVSPNNLKATLGTIIKDIEAKSSKWAFVLAGTTVDGVEEVRRLMALLWSGQTSRHGGVNPTRPETPDEARAAVHLAATLVQWCVSGAFAAV